MRGKITGPKGSSINLLENNWVTTLFLTDYAATLPQPYLTKVFNTEEVVFNKFLEDFKSSFFDHNCQHHAEVSLQSLRQTGTVLAYTQEFNSHAPTVGLADTTDESLPAQTEGKGPTLCGMLYFLSGRAPLVLWHSSSASAACFVLSSPQPVQLLILLGNNFLFPSLIIRCQHLELW
ncbi:uncharacterized protein VP01_3118g2 [Puccinia sorghi]|uniref:Retrotransposon gag domain-containing protein n=1 Tax=Puccinia sorghi TaxID=27349 RepID=A0A0L6V047_9BASI|nr:uncharacterized protein VP01_3118g2 [Puccinia sorghi]